MPKTRAAVDVRSATAIKQLVIERTLKASPERVFDAFTDPDQLTKWWWPNGFTCPAAEVDLRVGGKYHMVFVTPDGIECSFRGTYLELDRPSRIVDTWLFEGWPDAEAVETMQLHETDGVTTLTMRLAFRDKAGRDHMTRFDGQQDSFDAMEDILRSLLDLKGTSPS